MSWDNAAILAAVATHLDPILQRHGLQLYDMDLHRGTRKSILRIFIDRPTGVDVEDCALVSEVLSRALDVEDPIPGAYTLEVSSPGLTRKLTKPRHFRGSLGRRAKIELRAPHAGVRSLVGVLQELSGEEGAEVVVVAPEGLDAEAVSVPLADIAVAQLVIEFGRIAASPQPKGAARAGCDAGGVTPGVDARA